MRVFISLFFIFYSFQALACEKFVVDNSLDIRLFNVKIKEPFCEKTQKFINKKSKNTKVIVKDIFENRYGEKYYVLKLKNSKKTINEHLLEKGYGIFYPISDDKKILAKYLKAEQKAKNKKRNFWKASNSIKNANEVVNDIGTYQVVMVKNFKIKVSKKVVYINVYKKRKAIFTIIFPKKFLSHLSDIMKAKKIEVRGLIKDFNGPMIDVIFLSQINII
jgi:hypothetical protein